MIGGIGGSRGAGCGVHLTHTGAAAETEASPAFIVAVFAASVAVCSLALAAFSEAFAAVAEVDASPALAV